MGKLPLPIHRRRIRLDEFVPPRKLLKPSVTDTQSADPAWSGPQTIDDFIQLSILGKTTAGANIMHRECGTLVELNPQTGRAVGKMKAVITQRFAHPEGFEYDVDCDCRFVFFCERVCAAGGHDWRAAFVKLVYEKDRLVPVDGVKVPSFSDDVLDKYPLGYRYLGAAQNTLGYEIDRGLVTGEDAKACGVMYRNMERWLDEPAFCRSLHPE